MTQSKKTDLFNDPIHEKPETDFASLFENSLAQTSQRQLNVGDTFTGEILAIGSTEAFIATGTPDDAVILTADLKAKADEKPLQVGDLIEVVVIRRTVDEIRVARKGSRASASDVDDLEDAFNLEMPVEGKVTEVVNGGFRITLKGSQLAFCPISQLGLAQGQDAQSVIGQKFEFLITQYEPKRRNIVVSRRKLMALQKAEHEGTWLETHSVGEILTARVTRAESFGAFVDFGHGIEGLVHISEIGFTRLKHASEGVRPGDPVQVKLLKIEETPEGRLKISASIKQAGGLNDPWTQVPQNFSVGTVATGIVEKREPYGLFIRLADGVTGLLPRSKWRDSTESKTLDGLKVGDSVSVRVDEVLFEERRISLGLPTGAEDTSWREHMGGSASTAAGSSKGFSSGGLAGALASALSAGAAQPKKK